MTTFGANVKCADCGKYGHHGGDLKCTRYAEMAAFRAAQKKRDEAKAKLDSECPPPPSPWKPTAKEKQKSSSSTSAKDPWDQDVPGEIVAELACPKCKKNGMVIRKNRLDDSKFYGCANFGNYLRCKGTYTWNVGQGMLRDAGPAGRSFR